MAVRAIRSHPYERVPFPRRIFSDGTSCSPAAACRPPSRGQSRKPVRPIGNAKALRMEGLFCSLRPTGGPRLRGADPRGSRRRTGTPDGAEVRLAETPAWHLPSRPGNPRAGDVPGCTSCRPASRLSGPKPPPDGKPAPKAPCALPEAAIVRYTGYAPTGSSGRQKASSPDNVPPPVLHRVMQPCERPSPPAPLPSGRRSASTSRRVATAWDWAISRHFLLFLHTLCPAVWPCRPAARQGRGLPARPEENFFWDGESRRGEGAVLTGNAPAPAPHCAPRVVGRACRPPFKARPRKRQERGQSPAPALRSRQRTAVNFCRRCA